nr:hypothetical protein CFP56_67645 [Quercus suber]
MDGSHSYVDYNDSIGVDYPSQQAQPKQPRRPPPQGSEHVKHRRTRSGCYTCRQRRVKVSRASMLLTRCRKGKRECTYPGAALASTSPLSSRSKSNIKGFPDASSSSNDGSGDEVDHEIDSAGPIPLMSADGDEDETMISVAEHSSKVNSHIRITSETLKAATTNARISLTRPPSHHSNKKPYQTQGPRPIFSSSSRWATLPKDVQGFLMYHHESLSYHHYAFKHDGRDFLKTTFLELAINDDSQALLYVLEQGSPQHRDPVGHPAARDNRGPINIRVIHIIYERLTRFQEFLGDWVTLLGHQKAAHQILTSLFTPDTIVQDETRLKVIFWYIRFDLFAGIMSGGQLRLERVWYSSLAEFHARQTRRQAENLDALFDEYFATTRLLATDAARLVTASNQHAIDEERFKIEVGELVTRYHHFHRILSSTFTNPSVFVKSWPLGPLSEEESIVDFRDPHFLFDSEHFVMNYVLIDFWTIDLNFRLQIASMQGRPTPPELPELAMKICKMIDAIHYSDQGPPGAILGCQAALGIASLFLPKDRRCTDWLRRHFALVEQHGYIYPTTLRKHMSFHWNEDVTNWWLPHDDAFPASIRAVKEFVASRTADANGAWVVDGADLRDMSGIFGSLNAADSVSERSRTVSTSSETLERRSERSSIGDDQNIP